MNTIQINKIMKKDAYTKNIYLGTLPIDKLPKKVGYPSCIVINNQKSTEPGEHWIAIYFDKQGNGEFFDSFGNPPNYYNLQKYLKNNCLNFDYNKKKLQSDYSLYCGYYCVLYLLLKARHLSMEKILKYFSTPRKNIFDF